MGDNRPAQHKPEVFQDDLENAHNSIEAAFVRVRGSLPFPRIELQIRNQASGEAGWHRIELSGSHWGYAYDQPPAGIVAACDFLETTVDVDEFEQWWCTYVGFGGEE